MPAHITHLFLKPSHGQPTLPCQSLKLIPGHGIEGDCNAIPISPRQVLVTRLEDLEELEIPLGGLRENLIVQGLEQRDFQPGASLRIGPTAELRLTMHCEPCKRIESVVPSLKAVQGRRGILAVVITGGIIRQEDPVFSQVDAYEPLPEIAYERFLAFVRLIPKGKVVTYQTIAQAIGVADSAIRAMPGYIRRALETESEAPLHRIVAAHGRLAWRDQDRQAVVLEAEGIECMWKSVHHQEGFHLQLAGHEWQVQALYLNQ